MEKVSKKALSDKLIERLDIIFATAKTRDFFIKDPEFQRLIGKQILIMGYLDMTKEADHYKDLASNASKAFEMPKYTAPTTLEDAADEVNFLDIYIKNTFKKDLFELRDDEIKAKANPPQPQQQAVPVAGMPMPGNNRQGFGGNGMGQQQSPFMGNPFMGGYAANMRPHPLQDPNFYPYTTKPKYMPLCRNLIGVLFVLLAICQILIVIGQAINKNTVVAYFTDTSGAQQPLYYSYTNSLIIPIILMLVLAYMSYTYLRPTKYDRVKYRVNATGAITTILLFAILNIINDFWIGNNYNVLTQKDKWLAFPGNNAGNIELLYACSITFYAMSGATIIFAVVVQYFNPPIDQEKVMAASQEWFEQVQGGGGGQHDSQDNS